MGRGIATLETRCERRRNEVMNIKERESHKTLDERMTQQPTRFHMTTMPRDTMQGDRMGRDNTTDNKTGGCDDATRGNGRLVATMTRDRNNEDAI